MGKRTGAKSESHLEAGANLNRRRRALFYPSPHPALPLEQIAENLQGGYRFARDLV